MSIAGGMDGRRWPWVMWGSATNLKWGRLHTSELKAEEALNRALQRIVGWMWYMMVPGEA